MKTSKKMQEILNHVRSKTGDSEADFSWFYTFDGEGKTYTFPVKYRKKKRDGEFTKKIFEMPVKIQFCPFTGEKLQSSKIIS
jgi:hypothetical protein